jgi:hypothetical protein
MIQEALALDAQDLIGFYSLPYDLYTLSKCLTMRFEATKCVDDAVAAVNAGEEAINLAGENHAHRLEFLTALGFALLSRSIATRSTQDIDEAIEAFEEVVQNTARDRTYSDNLVLALLTKFEMSGSIDDLNRLVESIEATLLSIPEGHPDREDCQINLGIF